MSEPTGEGGPGPGVDPALAPFTVRRAVEKVGRNEPCPCGSGKKYKRCCLEKDRERLADPSPFAGMTMEEAKREPGRHGDPSVFYGMSPKERAAVDTGALTAELLVGLFEVQLELGEIEAARRSFDAIDARADVDETRRAGCHDALVYEALRRRKLTVARAELKRRPPDGTLDAVLNALTLELAERAPKPKRLDAIAGDLVDDQAALVDLADALSLAGLHGVALLASRAAAAIPGRVEKAVLDDLIHEQREHLGRRDDDPATWLVLAGGKRAGTKVRANEEALADLRGRLVEREAELRKLRAERDRLAGELARALSSAAPAVSVPADVEEMRRLRRKIDELQVALREAKQEEQAMRARLRASSPAEPSPPSPTEAKRPAAPEEPDGEPLPDDAVVWPVEFTSLFQETAADLDGRLVLRAQEVAVRFAALDPATWKQAKKMADLANVFTLRVGIHHRLFLTRSDGRVAARELVSREAFERTLKRYRR